MERRGMAAIAGVGALTAAVAFSGQIKSGVESGVSTALGTGESLVSGAWDATGIPELADDARDCYIDTQSSSHTREHTATVSARLTAEHLPATRLQELRQQCSNWTGFLEGLVRDGGIVVGLLTAGVGGVALKRRLTK